jgi:hypothetical protein
MANRDSVNGALIEVLPNNVNELDFVVLNRLTSFGRV